MWASAPTDAFNRGRRERPACPPEKIEYNGVTHRSPPTASEIGVEVVGTTHWSFPTIFY